MVMGLVTGASDSTTVRVDSESYEIVQDGSVIGNTSERTWTVSGLQADTRYSFPVNGISEDGLRSLNVPRQSVTLLTTGDPIAPATVDAFAYAPATIEIIWPRADYRETYAVGYVVLRDGKLIDTVDALSLMDTGLSPDTTYNYSVRDPLRMMDVALTQRCL